MQAELRWDDEPSRRPDDDADFLANTCPTCRSDDLLPVGLTMAKCNGCGGCLERHAVTGQWTRLATLFGGKRLQTPRRKPR